MKDTELIRSKGSGLLQLLIPFITWSIVNVSADVNDFHLISLDTIRVSREEVCLPNFAAYCLDSSPQFGRKIFSPFLAVGWKPSFSQLVHNLLMISVPVGVL